MMTKPSVALLLISSACFAQPLKDDIKQVYDFSPSQLTREEQEKKIPPMDNFWNKVKGDTTTYLPALRAELQADGNPKFFYFEGGQLLLSLCKSLKDKQIVLNGILKTDLKDVDRRSLVSTLAYLAKAKLNTTAAALKIVDDKEFRFYLPEHSFYFNQGYCLTYALLPTDPVFYLSAVIDRFKMEKDVNARKAIITLLWFANTCDGNEFLKKITADKISEKEVLAYAKDLLNRAFKKEKEYKELNNLGFDELIKAQDASTNRMSDEAIYELDYITRLLRQTRCRK